MKLFFRQIDNFKPDLELYSKNFTKLTHQLQLIKDQQKIPYLLDELNKTNAKLQSLGLVVMHYKAGILHCRYLDEKQREKQRNEEQRVGEVFKIKIDNRSRGTVKLQITTPTKMPSNPPTTKQPKKQREINSHLLLRKLHSITEINRFLFFNFNHWKLSLKIY